MFMQAGMWPPKKTGLMEMNNMNFYLVLVLSGIIIGGAVAGALLAPLSRLRQHGYYPPVYPDAYGYGAYPERRTAALPMALLFLLLLLALIFLGLRNEQGNRPENPVPTERNFGLSRPENTPAL